MGEGDEVIANQSEPVEAVGNDGPTEEPRLAAIRGGKMYPRGILGPMEDPIEKYKREMYDEQEIVALQREEKGFLKPVRLATTVIHTLWAKPAEMLNNIITAIRPEENDDNKFYHRIYPRVKNIWECDKNDPVCIYEAEHQFMRDKRVDEEIIEVLKEKMKTCEYRNSEIRDVKCKEISELYQSACNSYHIKYGELGITPTAENVLNKQKNRFIENRYLERVLKRKIED